MSTMTLDHGTSARDSGPVRSALRWLRETPAPRWSEEDGGRRRFVVWVGAHMVAWTGIGIGGAVVIARALEAIPTVLG